MRAALHAPFPYFGGKRRAAPLVWSRLGDPGICGLAGEHDMPSTWEAETWNAPRGYSTKKDRPRETIWFSPHCIKQRTLFSDGAE